MKRFYPLAALLAAVVLTAGAVVLTAGALLLLGGTGISRSDHDPAALRAGALLAYLRDGQSFELGQVYPGEWDRAQFTLRQDSLLAEELRQLYGYSRPLAESGAPLLIFWQGNELVEALPLPRERDGFPWFVGALQEDDFSISREEARFTATFVENGRGGYYRCQPVGQTV